MRQDFKYHAIAIAPLSGVITVIYFLMGPKEAAAPADQPYTGTRYIEIYSATWGEACNSFIREKQLERAHQPPEKDASGALKLLPPLTPVAKNNVLETVSNYCNGKLTCELRPTSDMLGVEPFEECRRTLDVAYRCYSFDRLWTKTISQQETAVIDCNESAAPPTGAAGQATPAGK